MSDSHDDDQERSRAARIKHGIKPGKADDDEQDTPRSAADAAGKLIGGLGNIGERPTTPPAAAAPKPRPSSSAPRPNTPAPTAPKPSLSTSPKPTTPKPSLSTSPKPTTPKPGSSTAPKPTTPKPGSSTAPKPPAPKPPAPKPGTSAAPKPPAPKPGTSAAPKPGTSAAPKPGTSAAPKPGTSAAPRPPVTPALGGSLTLKDLQSLRIGGTAYVQQAGGKDLRLRSAPGLQSTVLGGLPPGTRMTLLAGPRADDGYDWWQIRTSDGREGWVAGSELVTSPED